MKSSSIIGHCLELLADILRNPVRPADRVISRFFRDRRYLGSRDRGQISDIVYETLRYVLRHRYLLRSFLEGIRPDREAPIQLAAVLTGTGISDIEIAEGTGLSVREIGRIREVREQEGAALADLEEPLRSAVHHSMPLWFVRAIHEQMGEESNSLLESLNRQAPIALRANTLKTDRERLTASLAAQEIACRPGLFSADAVILGRRMNANSVPEFKAGWFELQDEGSQMLSLMLDPHPNWRVFDACAGAGGKSLHLAAIMKGRGEVTAHDVNARRLEELRPRLKRSGAQNIRMMDHDRYRSGRDALIGRGFDAVMIDAPCTGTGVLRRNPGARLTLDEAMPGRVTKLQESILDEYSALVKPGGFMLYATCSLLRRENEQQVELFLERHPQWSLLPPPVPDALRTAEGYYRSSPHRPAADAPVADAPDGFFGALLRRL